jgi:predicted Fe-S protein YdhL (DUF1289 family)
MNSPLLQPALVASPCIKVCVLDREGMCTGCGRKLEEIAAWSRLEPEAQRQIVAAAARRLEQARAAI